VENIFLSAIGGSRHLPPINGHRRNYSSLDFLDPRRARNQIKQTKKARWSCGTWCSRTWRRMPQANSRTEPFSNHWRSRESCCRVRRGRVLSPAAHSSAKGCCKGGTEASLARRRFKRDSPRSSTPFELNCRPQRSRTDSAELFYLVGEGFSALGSAGGGRDNRLGAKRIDDKREPADQHIAKHPRTEERQPGSAGFSSAEAGEGMAEHLRAALRAGGQRGKGRNMRLLRGERRRIGGARSAGPYP